MVSLKLSEQRAHTEHAEMRLHVEEQERTITQLEALLERQRLAEAAGAGARRPTTTERNAVSKNASLTAELSDLRSRYNLLTLEQSSTVHPTSEYREFDSFVILCRFEALERELSKYKQFSASSTAPVAHPSAQSQQQSTLRATRTSQSEPEASAQQSQQQAGAQVVRLSRKELRELSEDELANRLSKSNLSASSLAGLALGPGGSSSTPSAALSAPKQYASQSATVADAASASGNTANSSQPLRTAAPVVSESTAAAVRRQPHPPATASGTSGSVAATHLIAGAHALREASTNESGAAGHKHAQRDREARASFGPADSLDPN